MAETKSLLREAEAAAYLQINPRTLRRHRQRGTLPYREAKGATRPVIVYEQADVEALKATLERQRTPGVKPQPAPAVPRSQARRVSFGLPPEAHAELVEEASRYGMSAGEYARRLVREGLESRFQSEAAELRSEMQRLATEIERMRADFAGGFEAILEFTGLSPEDAKQWVTDNLR